MKSKASFKSHPLHPMLVAFPIGFFTGTLVFDVLGMTLPKEVLLQVGAYMCAAGILGGIAAAVPGIIDYIYTVPPKSSGKKRAAKHGLLNSTVLVLMCVSLWLRTGSMVNMWMIVAIEAVAVGLMVIAGYMGGTLVYRNQIGVDPRYAGAGKWNEEYIRGGEERIAVVHPGELERNQMKLVHVKGKRIVVARGDDGYYAFDDRCTHRGASLAGGAMICNTVHCPWHGSHFDVKTGAVKEGPAEAPIATYTVEEEDGKVYLIL